MSSGLYKKNGCKNYETNTEDPLVVQLTNKIFSRLCVVRQFIESSFGGAKVRQKSEIRKFRVLKQVAPRVLFRDLTDGACGVSEGEPSCGNVARDNAARTDHSTATDPYAVQYRYVGGNPHLVLDRDAPRKFRHRGVPVGVGDLKPFFGNQRMIRRQKAHVRADHDAVADLYYPVVHHQKVEVGEELFADERVGAVVELHGTLEIDRFAVTAQNGLEQRLAFGVVLVHRIETATRFVGAVFNGHKFGTVGIEEFVVGDATLFVGKRGKFHDMG